MPSGCVNTAFSHELLCSWLQKNRFAPVTGRNEWQKGVSRKKQGERIAPLIVLKREPGLAVEVVQRLLKAIGVAALGLGKGFEPVCDLVEALVTRGLGHTRVHIGVLVSLTGD